MTKNRYLLLAPAALIAGTIAAKADAAAMAAEVDGIVALATTTFTGVAAISVVVVTFGILISLAKGIRKR